MSDDRIPKILMYRQIKVGKFNVRRPLKRCKDKLRSKLKFLEIPLDSFENRAKDLNDWRKTCHLAFASFESKQIRHLLELHHNTKLHSVVSAEQPNVIFVDLYADQ